ncbi:MAG TPA: response regulator, partial [Thermodesulfobacteriota bacterium]|nr:response regulator [Thermodesulfobacteriota bacterium]
MSQTVLVIDDEEFLCKKLSESLSDDGFLVSTANNGETGLLLARRDNPDLILLDLRLPDMDGIEALGQINNMDPKPVTILMSGHGNVDMAVSAIKMGAYDFIEKPFSLDKLKIIVKNALDNVGLKRNLDTRLRTE